MKFNYNDLIKAIIRHGTLNDFAGQMGISLDDLAEKLNNEQSWTQIEIAKAVQILKLSIETIPALFFMPSIETDLFHACTVADGLNTNLTGLLGVSAIKGKTLLKICSVIGISVDDLWNR